MDHNKIIAILILIIVLVVIAGISSFSPSNAKTDTQITVTSNESLHDGDCFSISLTDINATPLANQTVNITIIDANGGKNPQVVTTDENGNAMLQLNGLTPGNYTVNAEYGGNDKYNSSNTTQKLQMVEEVKYEEPATSYTDYDDGYWETSPDANFEYHTEHYPDGNIRQYDRKGRLVGSTYKEDQYEVGSNVGFKI